MNKKVFLRSLWGILLSIVFGFSLFGLSGCFSKQSLVLSVNRTEVDYGDIITLSPNYKGSDYYWKNHIEYFANINGEDICIGMESSFLRYKVTTSGDITFWAKICTHSVHKDTSGDIVSNMVSVRCVGDSYQIEYEEKYDSIFNDHLYVFNSHYYALVQDALLWKDAELKCEQVGGHLVTITSDDENSFIYKLIGKYNLLQAGAVHIGGYKQNNSWNWVTNEPFDYDDWSEGQPDNSGEYLSIWDLDKAFGWDDLASNCVRFYICEWDSENDIGKTNCDGFYFEGISTAQDLEKIHDSNKNYALLNDIDLSSYNNWTPITNFKGLLDGNGHSITGLKMNATNQESVGLFDTIHNSVQNLIIKNAAIKGQANSQIIGILAGKNYGRIENVTVSGIVDATFYNYVGGIIGRSYDNAKVLNCTNEATIKGNNNVGGIAGYVAVRANNILDGNANKGVVNGNESVGGIAGYVTGDSYEIANNINQNKVSGVTKVGGIFGTVEATNRNSLKMTLLTNSYYSNVTGSGDYVGGIIGHAIRLGLLSACENHSDISGQNYVGGFVGYAASTNIKANNFTNENVISGRGYVGGFAGYAGVIENAINNGVIISTGARFEGNEAKSCVGGIAGYCNGALNCVNNSDIIVDVEGKYVGGIAGYVVVYANNMLNGNTNTGAIKGYESVGGIAGYVTGDSYEIANNINQNEVSGVTKVGGIFGTVEATNRNSLKMTLLTNSYYSNVTGSGDYVGGIIGHAIRLGLLSACENHSDISGQNYVGGFVGYAASTNIKANNFTNENVISGRGYVGGFAGYAGVIENAINNGVVISTGSIFEGNEARLYVGGIAGYCNGALNCVNNSDIIVDVEGKYVGGIAGYVVVYANNMLNGNTNTGAIKGYESVGGIAGYVTGDSYEIANNINQNEVSGVTKVGGIFGTVEATNWNNLTVIYCDNIGEVSGNTYVGGIIGSYNRLKTDDYLMDTNTTLYGPKLGQ